MNAEILNFPRPAATASSRCGAPRPGSIPSGGGRTGGGLREKLAASLAAESADRAEREAIVALIERRIIHHHATAGRARDVETAAKATMLATELETLAQRIARGEQVG